MTLGIKPTPEECLSALAGQTLLLEICHLHHAARKSCNNTSMSLKSLLRDSSFGPENIVCDFAPMLKVMVTKLPAVVALPRAAAEAWGDATAVSA